MPLEVRLAAGGGGRGLASSVFSSAASGEGLMCFLTGPGTVWIQTHKPKEDAEDGDGKVRRRSSGGGGGGGLAGCCVCCCFIFIIAAAVIGLFVILPMYGGRLVETYPGSGSYDIRWDQPTPPPRPRPRVTSSGERYDARGERYSTGERYDARDRRYDTTGGRYREEL